MALLHAESFDGVSTIQQLSGLRFHDDLTKKWVYGNDSSFPPTSTSHATFGPYITDNGLILNIKNNQPWVSDGPANADMALARPVPLSAKLIMGLWFRKTAHGTSGSLFFDTPIAFSTRSVGTLLNGGNGVGIAISTDLHELEFYRLVAGAKTVLATATVGLIDQINTDYYIELSAEYGTSAACRVRVNEVDWINGTFNTKGASSDTGFLCAGIFGFARHVTAREVKIDDLYICDGTGSINNDLLGVVSVPCIRADAQGSNDDWVNSHGLPSSDNYTRVNEQNVDDGTYIQSPNVGERDTHEYTDIVAPGPRVAGVILNSRAASTGGGRSMKALAIDGVDEALSADLALDGFLRHKQAVFETHPDGVSEWTAASINSTEFGVETT